MPVSLRLIVLFAVFLAVPVLAQAQDPFMWNDIPASGATVPTSFTMAGWAIDRGAPWGTGVDTLHVWAYPNPGSGAAPIWVGVATYGFPRPDVGAVFGARFSNPGYAINVSTLPPGYYQIVLYAHNPWVGFNQAFPVNVTVQAPTPTPNPCEAPSGSDRGPALSLSGDRFLVDGQTTDLLLVSYFDGLDLDEDRWADDLDYFKRIGVDGVRLFPNWWQQTGEPSICSPNTLFKTDGGLNMGPDGDTSCGRLGKLRRFLDKASEKRLIVDVTFSRETVGATQSECGSMTVPSYQTAIGKAAAALKPYRNVLFDLQNEWPQNGFFADDMGRIKREAVDPIDDARIVVASHGDESSNAGFAAAQGMDAAAVHDNRQYFDWYERTDDLIEQTRSASGKPVYLSEPWAWEDDGNGAHFRRAWQLAKEHRAAAWVFHTRAGFTLGGQPMRDLMDPGQRATLEALKGSLVNLRGWRGYLAAEIGAAEPVVTANRSGAGLWETFQLHDLNGPPLQNGDTVTLLAANGKYLQAENNGLTNEQGEPARLIARGDQEGQFEQFIIGKSGGSSGSTIGSGDSVNLRTKFARPDTGQTYYVVAELDSPPEGQPNVYPVLVNREAPGIWETFQITIR
jgi:hypothetical protein